MKTTILSAPKTININGFIKNKSTDKSNELIWFGTSPTSIDIIKIHQEKSAVYVETSNGNQYHVRQKSSKKALTTDCLQSELKTLTELADALLNGQPKLMWHSYNGIQTNNNVPSISDHINVANSLTNQVLINEETLDGDSKVIQKGLRSPQIGAVYAILSNWAISNDSITIVLPTGTGKSETILTTIATKKISKSLIIVPSDALRNQFYNNATTWGILRSIGIIGGNAENPIVLKLGSSPSSPARFKELIECSNIIIATSTILNKLKPAEQKLIAQNCKAIFVDEAHHSAAPTWDTLKQKFAESKIIQFTATPFREDGKSIGGKIAFNYPLEEAQKNKYFTKIDFVPVIDYDPDNWDKSISEKAIEVLESDIKAGHSHILMARVDNIAKAKIIFEKYYQHHTKYNPVLITSKTPSKDAIQQLRSGHSKVVVCVNMLGEGIDIPQLKIAALHDIRKSLTITLQFIGRFTRSNKSNAAAKIIANIADVKIEKKLKQLYKEDADWGKLIAFASSKAIQSKIRFQELLANFTDSTIPLFNIKPKLSAVAYKTKDDWWKPKEIQKWLDSDNILNLCDINEIDNIAIAIYQTEGNIDWLDSDVFIESTWELLLFYFDKSNKILYVNSSNKNVDLSLVERVVNIDYKFDHELPFKCYHNLGYVVLFTMGLDKNTDSPIKYAMYAGDDIINGITDMERNKSSKSNTYGSGYNDGEETTLGASKNGKIWSRLIGNIQEWREWCDGIGMKLLDPAIVVDDIFKGFLQPSRFNLDEYLTLQEPTSVDWPNTFYQENEAKYILSFDGYEVSIGEITLLVSNDATGYIITLKHEAGEARITIKYDINSFKIECSSHTLIELKKGRTTKDFIEYLRSEDTFKIRLWDGTFVENNYHFSPYNADSIFPLDENLFTSLDWTGCDKNVESMTLTPPYLQNSVQYKIYSEKNGQPDFQIIFNDDNAGEVADLVCIGLKGDDLLIEVVHCKYLLKSKSPGTRTGDFYELCCQAQKTVKNFANLMRLFDHLKSRHLKAEAKGQNRFLKGDIKQLELLIKSNSYKRPKIKVILVQPALEKSKTSANVKELLGSTYTLLKETINADFEVLCS